MSCMSLCDGQLGARSPSQSNVESLTTWLSMTFNTFSYAACVSAPLTRLSRNWTFSRICSNLNNSALRRDALLTGLAVRFALQAAAQSRPAIECLLLHSC